MSMNKITIHIFAESDFYNIGFDAWGNFYYSSHLSLEYLDMGGGGVLEDKYKNLIRRMNKYFIKKKNWYNEEVI